MVDEATKKTLAAIPLCSTRAGPRDGDKWVTRLKEEYTSLIKVVIINLFGCVLTVQFYHSCIFSKIDLQLNTINVH